MKRFFWGFVFGIVLLIAVPLALLLTGTLNIGATQTPSAVETTLASWTVNRSVNVRAPQELNPVADEPAARAAGLNRYCAACVHCHGAPGVPASDFAAGLNPSAPAMTDAIKNWSDGELFWITRHGIRFTGMPAFSSLGDDEIWKVVLLMRHLNNLSESELAQLRTARIGQAEAE
jgi:mono/diheme cytochrome c family protein